MNTISLWRGVQGKPLTYPKLDRNFEVDVAIVGAGITGITAALQLIRAGKRVAILEAGEIGKGTTGDSTGNLYVAVQPYYHFIKSKLGGETVKAVAQSRAFSIDFMEALVKEKQIDCFFHRRPWYLYSKDRSNDGLIEREVKTLKEAGLGIQFVDAIPLPVKISKAAKMDGQARFDPLKYITALAEDLVKQGCLIFSNTRFLGVEGKKPYIVHGEGGKLKAKHVILATHTPKGINILQSLAIPYRSYAVAVTLRDGQYPNANFWDTSQPHHATSTHSTTSAGLDLLVVADSHHKTGLAPGKNHIEMYRQIEAYLERTYEVESIAYRWSAQHYQTLDGVPYIGRASRASENIYLATGYFADGLPYGTIAGILLTDLIMGRKNPWEEIYDPSRIRPPAKYKRLFKENFKVSEEYQKDFPDSVDAKKFSDLEPGEGRTAKIKGEKLAAYRDENRALHILSAVCPHMHCIVNWNDAEKSWDCPCHGSRFTCKGEVIEGPAIENLEKRSVQ